MSCPRYQRHAEAGERETWNRNRDAGLRPIRCGCRHVRQLAGRVRKQ